MIKLYDYFRSSASYRVRIALSLKQIPFECESVHLVKDGGQQHQAKYKELNPQGLVPTLVDGEVVLSQSLAILNYLEDQYPNPSLFPEKDSQRYLAQQIALTIACDVHPLNNLRVLKYLQEDLKQTDNAKSAWYQHWIIEGFSAIESQLGDDAFCVGNTPSIADICLVPQVYNALRFECSLSEFPKIQRIYKQCIELQAFSSTHPDTDY